jgi:hypothetical protein
MTLEELFNQSLQLIGDDAVIVTVNDNNKAARLCRTSYDTARRSVLQRHPWKFASDRVIVDVDTSEEPPFEYGSRYVLPGDYIRMITLNDEWFGNWTVEGGYILSNNGGPINLRYVKDITSLELFPPLFVDALVADLAKRIVYPLTQSNERMSMIEDAARLAIRYAKRANAIEQAPQALDATYWDESRLRGSFQPPGRP